MFERELMSMQNSVVWSVLCSVDCGWLYPQCVAKLELRWLFWKGCTYIYIYKTCLVYFFLGGDSAFVMIRLLMISPSTNHLRLACIGQNCRPTSWKIRWWWGMDGVHSLENRGSGGLSGSWCITSFKQLTLLEPTSMRIFVRFILLDLTHSD